MTESFENLDHILSDGMNDKVQKHLVDALNRCKKEEEEN